jgi:transposase
MSHHEQDDEQVFSRSLRACGQTGVDTEHEYASRWATIESIAGKIGCVPQTLLEWVKKSEIDAGKRARVPTEIAEHIKALEREARELQQANETLRKASAYFAQGELDRPYRK